MRRNEGSGCLGVATLILFACFFIYEGCNYLVHGDEWKAKEEKKKQEFIDKWKQSNIDYFKNFNCNDFGIEDDKLKIINFFAIATPQEFECDIHDFYKPKINFLNKYGNQRNVQEIKDANVLIWIKQIPGDRTGSYEDGSRAIRLDSEINFINLKTRNIFKKIIVQGVGEPPEKITKKGYTSPTKNIFYGTFDYEEISKVIANRL